MFGPLGLRERNASITGSASLPRNREGRRWSPLWSSLPRAIRRVDADHFAGGVDQGRRRSCRKRSPRRSGSARRQTPRSVPIVRSRADTMPRVTDGSPSSPSANPMAITSSPSRTLSGSAKVAAWKSVAVHPQRARGRYPTSVASRLTSRGSVSPASRTRILVARRRRRVRS